MEKICDIKNCTGCFACMNICPKNAISVGYDQLNKSIPIIDQGKCINCNLCHIVCPEIHSIKRNMPQHVYAAQQKRKDINNYSSSGGISDSLIKAIINDCGIAYGAVSLDGTVFHTKAETIESANKIQGSKYVQSDIGFIFRDVEEALKTDHSVIFTGTPCQIAGLKSYLRREYDKLLTVDLICHGVPPQGYFVEYAKSKMPQYNSTSFRNENGYVLSIKGLEKEYISVAKCDLYFHAFLSDLIFRDNCYKCQYSAKERVGDITIGDFWGLDKSSLKKTYNGNISVVLTNTNKGNDFWNKLSDIILYEERSLEEASNSKQTNLTMPSSANKDRKSFENSYPKLGFIKAVSLTNVGKEVRRNKFHRALKRIPGVKQIILFIINNT